MSNEIKLAALISGKMSHNVLKGKIFSRAAIENNISISYITQRLTAGSQGYDRKLLDNYLKSSKIYSALREMRRISINNDSIDLKFKELICKDLYRNQNIAKTLLMYFVASLVRKLPKVGNVCRYVETMHYKSNVFDDILRDCSFDVALTSSAGNYGFEAECIFARESRLRGKKIASVVTNYDNFLNRGAIGFVPDKIGVWSNYMADCANKSGIPIKNINVIGPIAFDELICNPGVDRSLFLATRKLDPRKPTILYAAGVILSQVVDVVNLFQKKGVLDDCNLIIRPYPHAKVLETALWELCESYLKNLVNVYLTDAKKLSEQIDASIAWGYDSDYSDDKVLELAHCDVVVNHFSTFGLEACVLDKPTIQVAYDSNAFYAIQDHARPSINAKQVHNAVQIKSKATKIARSEDELIKGIREYIKFPGMHREERKKYVELECGVLDGKASKRAIQMIHGV